MKITHKRCFKCERRKPLTEFYKHPKMKDGHLGKCKTCTKTDVSANYRAKIEFYKEYERKRASLSHRVEAREKYAQTENGRASLAKAKSKYAKTNTHKQMANQAVNNATRDGKLVRQPCEVCGSTNRIHGHHDDYSKPLEVRWLCPKHHSEHHRRERDAKRNGASA